jgi:hypothetical protein
MITLRNQLNSLFGFKRWNFLAIVMAFGFFCRIGKARKSNLEPKEPFYYNVQREKLVKHARQLQIRALISCFCLLHRESPRKAELPLSVVAVASSRLQRHACVFAASSSMGRKAMVLAHIPIIRLLGTWLGETPGALCQLEGSCQPKPDERILGRLYWLFVEILFPFWFGGARTGFF